MSDPQSTIDRLLALHKGSEVCSRVSAEDLEGFAPALRQPKSEPDPLPEALARRPAERAPSPPPAFNPPLLPLLLTQLPLLLDP